MKKLVLFIVMLFVMACASNTKEINQNVAFDNIQNRYSVTTYFKYPGTYNECVYCFESQIDSVKIAEMSKAKDAQIEMVEHFK